jgi:hypothetical protein
VQQITGHDLLPDQLDHGLEGFHRPAAPVDEGRVRNVGAHAGEDLVQAIQRKVVVELGGQDVGQQAGARPWLAPDRPAGRGFLHHLLAASAGFPDPGNLDDLQPGGDHVEQLADIFAHDA